MIYTRAQESNIPAINELLLKTGQKPLLTPDHLKYDISVVALNKFGVAGFIWCGVMANKKVGYIDMFTVDPDMGGQGIGRALGHQLIRIAKQKGIQTILASIARDEFHDRSLSSAMYIGLEPFQTPFTFVVGDVNQMSEKLGVK